MSARADEGSWTVALETEPDPTLFEAIRAPLVAFNTETAGPPNRELVVATVRDAGGTVVGGLWGKTAYNYLYVELLATGPARGGGAGTRLMQLAEGEARRRGLHGIWLSTWTFQAPGFYRKLGFVECGRIPGFPPGHDSVFMAKRLV